MRPGKALRDHWRVMRDTPEAAAARIREIELRAQAVREREERYPELTAENAGEAMAWQEARIRELLFPEG